ncbi:MAG: helix-turn-helix transcriptional regulator [Sulfuricellaceae bacterium]|nr:helix-turn-helix transcriptional regulator [Sulfuricellaceae bacterium]
MQTIGTVIRDTRKQRKLSQAQLGHSLGMSRATISGIETGKIAEVGIRKMMALCAALGLELTVGLRHQYPTLQELRQELYEQARR